MISDTNNDAGLGLTTRLAALIPAIIYTLPFCGSQTWHLNGAQKHEDRRGALSELQRGEGAAGVQGQAPG